MIIVWIYHSNILKLKLRDCRNKLPFIVGVTRSIPLSNQQWLRYFCFSIKIDNFELRFLNKIICGIWKGKKIFIFRIKIWKYLPHLNFILTNYNLQQTIIYYLVLYSPPNLLNRLRRKKKKIFIWDKYFILWRKGMQIIQ